MVDWKCYKSRVALYLVHVCVRLSGLRIFRLVPVPYFVVSFPTMTLLLRNRVAIVASRAQRFDPFEDLYRFVTSFFRTFPQNTPFSNWFPRFRRPSFQRNGNIHFRNCDEIGRLLETLVTDMQSSFLFNINRRTTSYRPVCVYICHSRSILLARVSPEKSFCCEGRARTKLWTKWKRNVSLLKELERQKSSRKSLVQEDNRSVILLSIAPIRVRSHRKSDRC